MSINLTLETVIQIVLIAVIVFCIWQQFQLRNQRAEIERLEAQVDVLIALSDPNQHNPNERGALWQKLVALRRPKSQSRKLTR